MIYTTKNETITSKFTNLPYDTIVCQNCNSTANPSSNCWYCGGYNSHCWNCQSDINSKINKKCNKCNKYYICSECGKCRCDYKGYNYKKSDNIEEKKNKHINRQLYLLKTKRKSS